MKAPRLSPLWRSSIALVLAALWLVGCAEQPTTPDDVSITAAKGGGDPITVDAVDPDSAVQDTTLDVQVFGSGYDGNSQASFEKSGGGGSKLTTNSTTVVSSTELVANVTVAIDADTGSYDVVVRSSRGRKGIGSELFKVKVNPGIGNKPPAPELAFSGFGLVVANATGSNETIILTSEELGFAPRHVTWSPNGSGTLEDPWQLAVNGLGCSDVLHRVDVDTVGGTPRARNLVPLGSQGDPISQGCSVSWSPIGDEIAYTEWSTPDPPSSLWVVPAAGGQPQVLYSGPVEIVVDTITTDPITVDTTIVSYTGLGSGVWSPDGQYIAFHENPNGVTQIRVIARATGDVVTVFANDGNWMIGEMDWMRTENAVTFWSDMPSTLKGRPGPSIWRLDLEPDGNGLLRASGEPVEIVRGLGHSWSPDDTELAIQDTRGVWIYTIATGDSRRISGVGNIWAAISWRRPPVGAVP